MFLFVFVFFSQKKDVSSLLFVQIKILLQFSFSENFPRQGSKSVLHRHSWKYGLGLFNHGTKTMPIDHKIHIYKKHAYYYNCVANDSYLSKTFWKYSWLWWFHNCSLTMLTIKKFSVDVTVKLKLINQNKNKSEKMHVSLF